MNVGFFAHTMSSIVAYSPVNTLKGEQTLVELIVKHGSDHNVTDNKDHRLNYTAPYTVRHTIESILNGFHMLKPKR